MARAVSVALSGTRREAYVQAMREAELAIGARDTDPWDVAPDMVIETLSEVPLFVMGWSR